MALSATPDNRHAHALHLAVCAAIIAFAIAFVYPALTAQSVPWYYPLERRWAHEIKPSGLAMDFYGRSLVAAIAAFVAFAASYALFRRVGRALESRRLANLFTAWALTATLFAMLNYAWVLYHRKPSAASLPGWYEPR